MSRHGFEAMPNDARRLKALEQENMRLKRLLADAMLDNVVLKDMARESRDDAPRQAGGGDQSDGAPRHQPSSRLSFGQPSSGNQSPGLISRPPQSENCPAGERA
jgi:hypothetical protein